MLRADRPQHGIMRSDWASERRAHAVFVLRLGNPVEDERDSGLKPNTIPL